MEKGLGKEMMRFGLSVIFRVFSMDAGGCAEKLWWFPVHVQWFSHQKLEQMIVTSLYDVTRVFLCYCGGNYKRETD